MNSLCSESNLQSTSFLGNAVGILLDGIMWNLFPEISFTTQ